jgi:hypothetical protein
MFNRMISIVLIKNKLELLLKLKIILLLITKEQLYKMYLYYNLEN